MKKISKRDLPKLIFMIGIPGSGKSTWISKNKNNAVVVSPDEIREEKTGNISDQSMNKEIWEIVKDRVSGHLHYNQDVILDATNISSKNRVNFIKDLPPHILQAKVFDCNPEKSWERIKKDLKNGVNRSDVPYKAIISMAKQFKEQCSLKQIKFEGFEIIN